MDYAVHYSTIWERRVGRGQWRRVRVMGNGVSPLRGLSLDAGMAGGWLGLEVGDLGGQVLHGFGEEGHEA